MNAFPLTITSPILAIPVSREAPLVRITLEVDGRPQRQGYIALSPHHPEYWVAMDVQSFIGRTGLLRCDSEDDTAPDLGCIRSCNVLPDSESLYHERLRPRFHFTAKRGWLNDPNGLIYHEGVWHLFFQHNPYGVEWNNMHWGHATSRDLVHWEEQSCALYPWTQANEHCFSGSAVVDHRNTSGFGQNNTPPMIACFTDTGAGESIAYSLDQGKTFSLWEGNPVVRSLGRDPKVFWHEETEQWCMAVYSETDNSQYIAFYTSPDLRNWIFQSRIEGYFECPELFPLPVDGNPNDIRWVLYAADARYVIGQFDGKQFVPEHEGKHQLFWGHYYAAQTFNDAPDGRRIQIGWARGIPFPEMPFNQMMTFPTEMRLRTTPDGIRMIAEPVKEIANLYEELVVHDALDVHPGSPVAMALPPKQLDFEFRILAGTSKTVTLGIGATTLKWDVHAGVLGDIPVPKDPKELHLRLLLDRPSLEVFVNQGEAALVLPVESSWPIDTLYCVSTGGVTQLVDIKGYTLGSAHSVFR